MGLVITSEEALMPGYAPDCILHRESEIKEIDEAIKPLFLGRHPDNLFIHGDPGTGKTACIKHILRKLEENSRVKLIYVNCWQHSTRMAIYSIISRAIDEMMPRRGLARDEVFGRITEVMEKEGTRVLLVLDEIDGLFFHKEERLLYDIGRANDGKPLFGVIGISDNAHLLARWELEGKDSVQFASMEFGHYGAGQMADILAQKARAGLAPDSWNGKTIEACARRAVARKSNARLGLELLWAAAKRAERAGTAKITPRDVKAADEHRHTHPLENVFQSSQANLSDEERLVLEIVKSGPKSSTDLYLAFFRKLKRSKRQIRNYLDELEAKKLLLIQTVAGVSPLLNTRVIQLNIGRGGI